LRTPRKVIGQFGLFEVYKEIFLFGIKLCLTKILAGG